MLEWLGHNAGSIAVAAALAAVVFFIVRRLIRDRRAGKTSCGCGCEGCAMQGACHAGRGKK